MPTTTQKAQFLGQMQSLMTELAALNTRMKTAADTYVARDYNNTDPITPTDLDDFGVGVYEMGVAVNVCQFVNALCAGQAVAEFAASPVAIAKWRTV